MRAGGFGILLGAVALQATDPRPAVAQTAPPSGSTSVRDPTNADDQAGWGAATPVPSGPAPDAQPSAPSTTESPASPAPCPTPEAEESPLHVQGSFRERGALWTGRFGGNPFAQARSALDLWLSYSHSFEVGRTPASLRLVAGVHGEFDAAYLYDPGSYDTATRDVYEHTLYARETYASLTLGKFEFASGRMIIPLGQAEVLNSLDVVNPTDEREPGLTEADRLHLPVFASRVTLNVEPHRLDAIVVHEAAFGLVPPPLGDFSPLRKLLVDEPLGGAKLASYEWTYTQLPSGLATGAWQVIGHYGFTGQNIDLDVYGGTVLDKLGVTASPPPQAYQNTDVTLDVYHPRYTMVAHAGAWTVGSFVVRWQLGVDIDRPETLRRTDLALLTFDMERLTQLDGMVGVTYFAPFDANIGVEYAQSYVVGDPARTPGSNRELLWPIEKPSVALRWTQDLLRQRVQLALLGVAVGVAPLNGAVMRAEVGYLFNDAVRVDLGYVHYVATSRFGPFYGFEDDDRVYVNLKWDFALL